MFFITTLTTNFLQCQIIHKYCKIIIIKFVSILVLVQDAVALSMRSFRNYFVTIMQCKHSFEYSEVCDGHAYFITCSTFNTIMTFDLLFMESVLLLYVKSICCVLKVHAFVELRYSCGCMDCSCDTGYYA